MSYTKMNVEIVKYLKENNLPVTGKSTDTKEQTEYRIRSYYKGRDFVFEKWIEEKKYNELISCAHGGWFNAEEFLVPLAQHFVDENDLPHLRLLCERGIRFNLEDILKLMKYGQEDLSPGQDKKDLIADVLSSAVTPKNFENGFYANSVNSIVVWRGKALRKLDRYIGFLQQIESGEYLQAVKAIREKTVSLQIRKSDLNTLKYKGNAV